MDGYTAKAKLHPGCPGLTAVTSLYLQLVYAADRKAFHQLLKALPLFREAVGHRADQVIVPAGLYPAQHLVYIILPVADKGLADIFRQRLPRLPDRLVPTVGFFLLQRQFLVFAASLAAFFLATVPYPHG